MIKLLLAALLGFFVHALRQGMVLAVTSATGRLKLPEDIDLATAALIIIIGGGIIGAAAGALFILVRRRFSDANPIHCGAIYFVCADFCGYAMTGFRQQAVGDWLLFLTYAVSFGALFGWLFGLIEKWEARRSGKDDSVIPMTLGKKGMFD